MEGSRAFKFGDDLIKLIKKNYILFLKEIHVQKKYFFFHVVRILEWVNQFVNINSELVKTIYREYFNI